MVKHKKPWGKLLPIPVLVAFLIGGLLFSTAIVVAYKVGNDQNIKQNKELSAMLNSINATPAANLKTGTPSAVKTPSVATNTAPAKNNDQILKDCLAKVEVLKSAASKMGLPQNEVDGFMQIAVYNCNNPNTSAGKTAGQSLDQKIDQLQQKTDQLEADLQNQNFWQGICSSRGEQFNALAGAGCK